MVFQALLNGLVDASIIALAAVSVSLIYGVRGFANFAAGDMMTVGAYVTLFAMSAFRAGIVVGLLVAIVFVAFLGIAMEFLVFSRLEGRGPVAPLVASIGIAFVLQNAIRIVFGTSETTLGLRGQDDWLLGLRDPLTTYQVTLNPLRGLVPLVMAAAFVASLTVLLQYTKLGKAMRATADNADLARISGIDVRFVRYATWALAGALSAAAGVMLAIRLNVLIPLLGFDILLLVFGAVILGGIGSPYGAMLGALVMGLAQNLFFPIATATGVAAELAALVPFVILILVLLVRPQGIAGRPLGFDLPPLRAELRKVLRSIGKLVGVPGRGGR